MLEQKKIHFIIISIGLVLFYYYKEYTIGNLLILLGVCLIKSDNVIKNDEINDLKIVKERLNKGDIGYMSYSTDRKKIIIKFDDEKMYMFDITIDIEELNYTNINIDNMYNIDYDRIKYLKKIKNYVDDFDLKYGVIKYKFNESRKLSLDIPKISESKNIKYMYLLRLFNDSDYYGVLADRAILLEDINYKYYMYNFDNKNISDISGENVDLDFCSINNLYFKKQIIGIEINTNFDDFTEFINTSKGIDKINELFLDIHYYQYDQNNCEKDKLDLEYIKELELANDVSRKLDLDKLFVKRKI
jgi:hypothetical protein